jgi:hypothetical protein
MCGIISLRGENNMGLFNAIIGGIAGYTTQKVVSEAIESSHRAQQNAAMNPDYSEAIKAYHNKSEEQKIINRRKVTVVP